MFALPFNFPFRKKDGSLTTIDDAISGGGGGGYVLPPATASTLGGIKVGDNLTVDSAGKLNAPAPTPPYTLPVASDNTLGGVKIGSGITIDENGAISASGGGGGSSISSFEVPLNAYSVNSGIVSIYISDVPSGVDVGKVFACTLKGSAPNVIVSSPRVSGTGTTLYIDLYNPTSSSVSFSGTIRVWYTS